MAIRLLNEGKVALPPELDHLRLVALLQSGLALIFRTAKNWLPALFARRVLGWEGQFDPGHSPTR